MSRTNASPAVSRSDAMPSRTSPMRFKSEQEMMVPVFIDNAHHAVDRIFHLIDNALKNSVRHNTLFLLCCGALHALSCEF